MSIKPERDFNCIEKKMKFLDCLIKSKTADMAVVSKQAGIPPTMLYRWLSRDKFFALNVDNYITLSKEAAYDERYMRLINRSHQGDLDAMIEYIMWTDAGGYNG